MTLDQSLNAEGEQRAGWSFNPAISNDGRFVAYMHEKPIDHYQIAVFDRRSGTSTTITRSADGGAPNGSSYAPSISGDGRIIAFVSEATDLIEADAPGAGSSYLNVFVYNQRTGRMRQATEAMPGNEQPNDDSFDPDISRSGRYITYATDASNISLDDPDGIRDVLLYDRESGTTEVVSQDCGTKGNAWSLHASVSRSGSQIAFESEATNLAAPDDNPLRDIFLRNMAGTCS